VEIRVTVGVPGQGTVAALATATLGISDGTIRARVTGVRRVDGGTLPDAARAEAIRRASITIPLKRLPFGITVTAVDATLEGLSITARAQGLVIRTR
jgi:hypothetical protein